MTDYPDAPTVLVAAKKKRKNTNKIGNEAELIAQRHLEAHGYLVHRAQRIYRYTGPGGFPIMVSCDVFAAFDLVAINKNGYVRFIQVTTGSRAAEKRRQMAHIPIGQHYDKEIWTWMKVKMGKGVSRARFLESQHFLVRSNDDPEPYLLRPNLKGANPSNRGEGTN